MPIICWGNLAKSADDVQKIEEGMQEYVERHNENPNAHQVEGSSLYMHKSEGLLDHPPGSISLRHLLKDSYLIFTCFEEIDRWSLTGNVSKNVFGAGLFTLAVEDDMSTARMWDVGPADVMDFSKNPFFQTTVFLKDTTNQIIYFGCGRKFVALNKDCFGFKVINNTLYAWWISGAAEHTFEISGITLTDHNVYRAYIDSSLGELYFYVNGVLKHTVVTGLPAVATYYLFSYTLQTTNDVRKDMRFCDLMIEVNR